MKTVINNSKPSCKLISEMNLTQVLYLVNQMEKYYLVFLRLSFLN